MCEVTDYHDLTTSIEMLKMITLKGGLKPKPEEATKFLNVISLVSGLFPSVLVSSKPVRARHLSCACNNNKCSIN